MKRIERARKQDLEPFLDVLEDASSRLHRRGIDQWPTHFSAEKILPDMEAGHAFVVRDDDEVIAATILSPHGDLEFWTHEELTHAAHYVAKVATAPGNPGLGAAVLDWCGRQAAREGSNFLRLDAWRTNTRLHQYYLAHEFRHVRTVTLAHRNSGALFERTAHDVTTEKMHEHRVVNSIRGADDHPLRDGDPANSWRP